MKESNLWDFVTFEDLEKYIKKGVAEDNERNNRSLQEYIEWRIRDWEDFCREMDGFNIETFEDYLEDSECVRSYANGFYSLNAWELRSFIKKRISELKALEKVSPYEAVWEWKGCVDFYGHTLTIR